MNYLELIFHLQICFPRRNERKKLFLYPVRGEACLFCFMANFYGLNPHIDYLFPKPWLVLLRIDIEQNFDRKFLSLLKPLVPTKSFLLALVSSGTIIDKAKAISNLLFKCGNKLFTFLPFRSPSINNRHSMRSLHPAPLHLPRCIYTSMIKPFITTRIDMSYYLCKCL